MNTELERRYRRLLRRMAGPRLLRAFAEAYPQARFVEIGSNDGSKYDHLREHIVSGAWRGIMVEPVPYVFERLRANYGHLERVALENVAVADRDGSLPFYHVAEASEEERAQLPDWYDTIGSFHREAVASHASMLTGLDAPCRFPHFTRINSEFTFELTIARQSCAALILPSANANLFHFSNGRQFSLSAAVMGAPSRRLNASWWEHPCKKQTKTQKGLHR